MAFSHVCREEDVPIGDKKAFKVDGKSVLLFHLEDGFFATQPRCPHLYASLKRGKIVDRGSIRCWLHRAQFDIRTGEVVKWANFPPGIQVLNVLRSEKPLETYSVKVQDGNVYVDVTS